MSIEEELAIIKPWAKTELDREYDKVQFVEKFNGYNIYRLAISKWGKGHKIGMPILAIIKEGKPVLLNDDEVMAVLCG